MPTDAVLMPIYPVPAIEHNHAHDDKLYPHSIYGPYWRPSGRTLTIDGAETPCTPAKLAVHALLKLSSLHFRVAAADLMLLSLTDTQSLTDRMLLSLTDTQSD